MERKVKRGKSLNFIGKVWFKGEKGKKTKKKLVKKREDFKMKKVQK